MIAQQIMTLQGAVQKGEKRVVFEDVSCLQDDGPGRESFWVPPGFMSHRRVPHDPLSTPVRLLALTHRERGIRCLSMTSTRYLCFV